MQVVDVDELSHLFPKRVQPSGSKSAAATASQTARSKRQKMLLIPQRRAQVVGILLAKFKLEPTEVRRAIKEVPQLVVCPSALVSSDD